MKISGLSNILKITVRLVLLLSCSWFAQSAHAYISGSMSCGNSVLNSNYTFEPGERINVYFSGNCRAVRVFPFGAGANLEITNTSGNDPATLFVFDSYSKTFMNQLGLGTYGAACLGSYQPVNCPGIPVNGVVNYGYNITGTAPQSPGTRTASIKLGITAVGYPNYSEWINTMTFRYTVASTACSLGSSNSVALNMGRFNGADSGSQSTSTGIVVNCPVPRSADIYLVPTQPAVNTTQGISRTTLTGLNMQSTWTDSGNAVNFTSPRRMYLRSGANTINVTFKPQWQSGSTSVGAFQAGYTLLINYL
ncbi:fimbrial protein [Pseudomonas coleopterorum]|uniref:fimbrial protein n=1 Tax=Pseudomonas coleopterorum TaxID=1605838 RepID=UPI001781B9B9|nr:fimbrial protein [Pseudomonas coleopterorum]MBD8482742.1 fimbrial protein [Pseudomonas coleopterorum]